MTGEVFVCDRCGRAISTVKRRRHEGRCRGRFHGRLVEKIRKRIQREEQIRKALSRAGALRGVERT